MDSMEEDGLNLKEKLANPVEDKSELIYEMDKLKEELNKFGFSFEDLVDEAPKHADTRANALDLSEKVSKDKPLVDFMYTKMRLPIKQISLKYRVTEKVIKGSKKFIITGIIIFYRNFRNLKLWIKR